MFLLSFIITRLIYDDTPSTLASICRLVYVYEVLTFKIIIYLNSYTNTSEKTK